MPVDVPIPTFELRYSGIFDLDKWYEEATGWFFGHKFEFHERVHKFKPPELEFEWEGYRKDTGYRKTTVNLKLHAWYYKDVIVKVGGKDRKMVEARVQVRIWAKNTYDYEGRFEKNAFLKTMRDFLHKVVWFWRINIIDWDRTYYELLDYQTNLRRLFDMSLPTGAYKLEEFR